ncbi:hypothetical protein JCM19379_28350 [Methyloparacoccus murrellii]
METSAAAAGATESVIGDWTAMVIQAGMGKARPEIRCGSDSVTPAGKAPAQRRDGAAGPNTGLTSPGSSRQWRMASAWPR